MILSLQEYNLNSTVINYAKMEKNLHLYFVNNQRPTVFIMHDCDDKSRDFCCLG